MTNQQKQAEIERTLESFVNQMSMDRVLEILSNIANGKAQRIRDNWQDEGEARLWDKAARAIYELSTNPVVLKIGSGR